MTQGSDRAGSLVISYLELRQAIGILGFALPFVILIGAWVFYHEGMQSSISDYYYTGMRDVFVGTMCSIGIFLFAYKGYEKADAVAGNVAGVAAEALALFPTAPYPHPTGVVRAVGTVHYLSAGVFFCALIYFSFRLFTKTNPAVPPTAMKRRRNQVYTSCAYIMAACLLLIVVWYLLPNHVRVAGERYHPVFVLESIAILAFGSSWLVKGETILKDEVPVPAP